jgi:hypothetical protein
MLFPSEASPTIGAEDHVLDSLVTALEAHLRVVKLLVHSRSFLLKLARRPRLLQATRLGGI